MLKNLVPLMLGMSLSILTVLKCYVLVTKSMPEIDENRVSKVVIAMIILLSFGDGGIKFSGDTKPTFNQVSFSERF